MNIKALFFGLVILLSSTSVFSNYEDPDKANKEQGIKEIVNLIQDIEFDYAKMDDQTIKVQFMINAENQIVILRTSDDSVDMAIKYKLNYQELKNHNFEVNKIYILPVTVQATS